MASRSTPSATSLKGKLSTEFEVIFECSTKALSLPEALFYFLGKYFPCSRQILYYILGGLLDIGAPAYSLNNQ